jgi:hypothetical protein
MKSSAARFRISIPILPPTWRRLRAIASLRPLRRGINFRFHCPMHLPGMGVHRPGD